MRPALAIPLALLAIAAAVGLGFAVVLTQGSDLLPVSADEQQVAESTPTPATTVIPADVCGPSFDFEQGAEDRVFHPYYTQQREVLGLAIVGGPGVSSAALDVAEVTIQRAFANNDLDERLAEAGAYVVIAEPGQGILDIPEFACLEEDFGSNFFTHVCGVADRADFPVATVNERDLLGDRRGPCEGVNVLYHELGHLVQAWGLDPPDYQDARLLYSDARSAGLYRDDYAGTNFREYFAEGTQAYFDAQDRAGERNRSWLEAYDPELHRLLERVYGG